MLGLKLNHISKKGHRNGRCCPAIIAGATLVSQIVEHTEIDEHLVKIAKNVIVEHLFYTISIATNNRTPGIFFHCINSQTCSTIRDTRVLSWHNVMYSSLCNSSEYWASVDFISRYLGMGSASERRCYIVTFSLIGWAHTQNGACIRSSCQLQQLDLIHLPLVPHICGDKLGQHCFR